KRPKFSRGEDSRSRRPAEATKCDAGGRGPAGRWSASTSAGGPPRSLDAEGHRNVEMDADRTVSADGSATPRERLSASYIASCSAKGRINAPHAHPPDGAPHPARLTSK